jgi:hypothetical protein
MMDTFETFNKISDGYAKRNLISGEPSCFNGRVNVRKYKVTVEIVDEPIEAIQARIQKMWDECDNHHNWGPLKSEAEKYGLTLSHNRK